MTLIKLNPLSPDWNPAVDRQAMARVWRDGQKKRVHIYRFLSTGTLEEKMYQRQLMKEEVAGSVISSAGGGSDRSFSKDSLRDLFNATGLDEVRASADNWRVSTCCCSAFSSPREESLGWEEGIFWCVAETQGLQWLTNGCADPFVHSSLCNLVHHSLCQRRIMSWPGQS